jgi:hypothetical protein
MEKKKKENWNPSRPSRTAHQPAQSSPPHLPFPFSLYGTRAPPGPQFISSERVGAPGAGQAAPGPAPDPVGPSLPSELETDADSSSPSPLPSPSSR